MKTFGLALVCATPLFAGVVHAEESPWNVGIGGGYSMLTMKAVNDANDAVAAAYRNTSPTPTATVGKVGSGYSGVIEGTRLVTTSVALGVRFGYLMAQESTLKVVYPNNATINWTQNSHVIPLLVGGRYGIPVNDQLSVNVGLFGGLGIQAGDYHNTSTGFGAGFDKTYTIDFNANGFLFEGSVGAVWTFTPRFGIGLDLGFRSFAVVPVVTKDVPDPAVSGRLEAKGGDTLKDVNNHDLSFDYSGLTTVVRLIVTF